MKLPFSVATLHIQVFANTDFSSVIMERDVFEDSGKLKVLVPIDKDGEEILKKVGKLGSEIIQNIAEINGVSMVVPYKSHIVVVHKVKNADWEEILPRLARVIGEKEVYLKRENGKVVEGEFVCPEDWNTLMRK